MLYPDNTILFVPCTFDNPTNRGMGKVSLQGAWPKRVPTGRCAQCSAQCNISLAHTISLLSGPSLPTLRKGVHCTKALYALTHAVRGAFQHLGFRIPVERHNGMVGEMAPTRVAG